MNARENENAIVTLAIGLIAGAYVGWEFRVVCGWESGLAVGMSIILLGALFALCQIDTRKTQNEAVSTLTAKKKEGLTAALCIGVAVGLLLGFAAGLVFDLKTGLTVGAAVGLLVGSLYGITVKRQPDIE